MNTRRAVAYVPSSERAAPPDGVEIVRVIGRPEPGLAAALEAIAAGDADTLLVARLATAAGSLGELVRLLDWLAQAAATLIAADVELDTATAAGRQTVAVLVEIDSWSREPAPPRRPRGRPGLASASPDLVQRIAALRERGLSLQAIADELNAHGIPTPRGGAEWRPSSVQAALGYRRPRPPVPGAPPPPRHRPGPPPPPPHPPRPRHD